jgi:hypothetical protein
MADHYQIPWLFPLNKSQCFPVMLLQIQASSTLGSQKQVFKESLHIECDWHSLSLSLSLSVSQSASWSKGFLQPKQALYHWATSPAQKPSLVALEPLILSLGFSLSARSSVVLPHLCPPEPLNMTSFGNNIFFRCN